MKSPVITFSEEAMQDGPDALLTLTQGFTFTVKTTTGFEFVGRVVDAGVNTLAFAAYEDPEYEFEIWVGLIESMEYA